MVMEKEAFSKTKIRGRPENNSNFGGKTSMHKSTSILDFLKRASRPPSGGSFTAYGILLCYANFNAMLICYIGEIQIVSSYMVELGWVEIA